MTTGSIHIDNNGVIHLPFGQAVEQYLNSLSISYGIHYKVQSRKRVNDTVKQELVIIQCIESLADYISWKTVKGQYKSTNCLDDVLQLTDSEKNRVQQISIGKEKDLQVWRWTWFCSGEIMLSEVDTDLPMRMIISGNYILQNIIHERAISRINLSQEACDLAILNRRANKNTTKEVKMKLLAPHNSVSPNELQKLYNNQRSICDDVKLHQLLERDDLRIRKNTGPWTIVHKLVTGILKEKGDILYYQQSDINVNEDIDRKYDLNSDSAPVLFLVVEDCAGYGTPIAFGVSNKENNHTIRLAVEAYIELTNGKGFMRIRHCAQKWHPYAMIDKHHPTKQGLQPIFHKLILCWFHIMQTLRKHFKDLRIADHYRYSIAIAFKVVDRSRNKEEAIELGHAYELFIRTLPLPEITKECLCNDIFANWLSEEWIDCFIDGGWLPSVNDHPGVKPMTTNNLTEQMNKSIKGRHENSSQFIFEAGQERLCVLLYLVKPVVGENDLYFYVKKGNNKFHFLYTMKYINLDNESYQLLQPLLNKLISKHPNGSFHDVCKHVHAAHLFNDIENGKTTLNAVKNDLVKYFCKKECAAPAEQKNLIIYSESTKIAFEEILQIFSLQGNDIFFLYKYKTTEKNPFRLIELPE
ncbi:5653_t:CDS:2 [Cetraspora pellucida]|uniref:5653_t:CDS:1 n=1 Tax=Cetraspora pellucida TaxID=1433469 RepID=A0A9N9J5Q4_9GLOM|nr:5653_t:CDS:2 [Cetraspora pellucida]